MSFDSEGLDSVHSRRFPSASLLAGLGPPVAPLLLAGMCTEPTQQRVSGAFGSGYFAAVPVFFMKQHQDWLLPLPALHAGGLKDRDLVSPNHIQVIIQG